VAIACTLHPDDRAARMEQFAALGRDALIDTRRDGTTRVLRFSAGGDVPQRLGALVAAESDCCAFIRFDLRRKTENQIVLRVETTADGQAALDEWCGCFTES
jgi:hypothetical protein